MRTVSGVAREVQRLRSWLDRPAREVLPVSIVRPLAGGRSPLLTDRPGRQLRGGTVLDQVDGTTCGSAVLIALAAWADPAELARLEGPWRDASADGHTATRVSVGFGARYDARQRQVHRESTRFWPAALGTSPWGMVAWLRRHAPAAGPYAVRLVDDSSRADLADAVDRAGAALAAGRPVPLLVGGVIPRHYVLAIGTTGDAWRVYEPTSGEVRTVELDRIRERSTGAVVGFDRLHAVLLPV